MKLLRTNIQKKQKISLKIRNCYFLNSKKIKNEFKN